MKRPRCFLRTARPREETLLLLEWTNVGGTARADEDLEVTFSIANDALPALRSGVDLDGVGRGHHVLLPAGSFDSAGVLVGAEDVVNPRLRPVWEDDLAVWLRVQFPASDLLVADRDVADGGRSQEPVPEELELPVVDVSRLGSFGEMKTTVRLADLRLRSVRTEEILRRHRFPTAGHDVRRTREPAPILHHHRVTGEDLCRKDVAVDDGDDRDGEEERQDHDDPNPPLAPRNIDPRPRPPIAPFRRLSEPRRDAPLHEPPDGSGGDEEEHDEDSESDEREEHVGFRAHLELDRGNGESGVEGDEDREVGGDLDQGVAPIVDPPELLGPLVPAELLQERPDRLPGNGEERVRSRLPSDREQPQPHQEGHGEAETDQHADHPERSAHGEVAQERAEEDEDEGHESHPPRPLDTLDEARHLGPRLHLLRILEPCHDGRAPLEDELLHRPAGALDQVLEPLETGGQHVRMATDHGEPHLCDLHVLEIPVVVEQLAGDLDQVGVLADPHRLLPLVHRARAEALALLVPVDHAGDLERLGEVVDVDRPVGGLGRGGRRSSHATEHAPEELVGADRTGVEGRILEGDLERGPDDLGLIGRALALEGGGRSTPRRPRLGEVDEHHLAVEDPSETLHLSGEARAGVGAVKEAFAQIVEDDLPLRVLRTEDLVLDAVDVAGDHAVEAVEVARIGVDLELFEEERRHVLGEVDHEGHHRLADRTELAGVLLELGQVGLLHAEHEVDRLLAPRDEAHQRLDELGLRLQEEGDRASREVRHRPSETRRHGQGDRVFGARLERLLQGFGHGHGNSF